MALSKKASRTEFLSQSPRQFRRKRAVGQPRGWKRGCRRPIGRKLELLRKPLQRTEAGKYNASLRLAFTLEARLGDDDYCTAITTTVASS